MFAVIKTGGKQYRVAQDDIVAVERLEGEAGDTVAFDSVLMMAEGDDIKVGAGAEGALVRGEILEQKRSAKVLILKKKRRKHYRRRAGHRQYQTVVKITEILGAAAASKAS